VDGVPPFEPVSAPACAKALAVEAPINAAASASARTCVKVILFLRSLSPRKGHAR
jgi:hypothetical protein